MATLSDLTTADNATPTITYITDVPNPLIEPLSGYASVADVFDRFPEEVYDQSTDSHLYRFLTALCGEAGAGILKNQAYIARLKNEGGLLIFSGVDNTYSEVFTFPRLPDETYPDFDPDSDVLNKDQWDIINTCDDKYKARIILFMQATRLGNSPEGIALAAESGSRIHCDVVENYKAFYDLLSDDPLGLDYIGQTTSLHEYIILPRVVDSAGNVDSDIAYTTSLSRYPVYSQGVKWSTSASYTANTSIVYPTVWNGHYYLVTAQTGNSGSTEPTWPVDGSSVVQGNVTYKDIGTNTDDYFYNAAGTNASAPDATSTPHLNPAIDYNMVHVLDTMRPVGALMSFNIQNQHFVSVAPASVNSSSVNFQMTRWVTGAVTVNWPAPDSTTGDNTQAHWILPGVETQSVHFPVVNRSRPVIYQTIYNVWAYKGEAELDSTYNTPNFFGGTIPRYPKYQSEHTGPTQGVFAGIFPFVQNAPKNDTFSAYKAVSRQTTPLILEGKAK